MSDYEKLKALAVEATNRDYPINRHMHVSVPLESLIAVLDELQSYRSRLENWDWHALLDDAKKGDFDSVPYALRDVIEMEETRLGADPEMQKP